MKPSLKFFFIMAMLLLGLAITLSFSAFTLNYFSQGLDRGLKQSLMEAADAENVEDGKPLSLLGYNIASAWEDVPASVKDAFDNIPPEESYQLQKKEFASRFFTRPENIYFVLKAINKSGQLRYVSKVIHKADVPPPKNHEVPHIIWIALFAISSIGIFLAVVLFIIHKVTKPVELLKNWAKSLDEDKLKQPIPDFQYSELNELAKIINSSLSSVQKTLEREMQFLSYASHELRTPITVVRTNTELLIKLLEKEGGTKKQLAVIERIDRVGKTMTSLTETLLWLSRDDSNVLNSEDIDIELLIKQLVTELSYLLAGKTVKLVVNTESYLISAAEIPCRIVLANLIRNAFQHTIEGEVTISQAKGSVSITNSSEAKAIDNSDLGFGLGLQLTQKLANRYGWSYSDNIETTNYQVQLSF